MFGFGKRAKIFDGKSKNEQVLAEMKSAVDQKKRVAPYEPFILTGHELADRIGGAVSGYSSTATYGTSRISEAMHVGSGSALRSVG